MSERGFDDEGEESRVVVVVVVVVMVDAYGCGKINDKHG